MTRENTDSLKVRQPGGSEAKVVTGRDFSLGFYDHDLNSGRFTPLVFGLHPTALPPSKAPPL